MLNLEKNKWLPFIAAIGANIIWGSTFLASKKVLAIATPFTAIAIRFLIAIIILLIVGFLRRNNFQTKLLKQNGSDLLRLGVVSYTILYAVQMYGLKYISSAQSAVIMLLAPIFTVIFESIRTSKISKMDSFSVLLGFTGAFLLIKSTHNDLSLDYSLNGFLFTFVASFCLGYSVVLTKQLHEKSQIKYSEKLSVFNLTFATMLIGTIGILPFSIYEILNGTMSFQGISNEFYLWSLYLGIICSVVAFLSWNWAIIYANPVVTAVSMYLKTPVAIILAAVFLAEQLNSLFYFGFLLILLPLFLKQLLTLRGKV